MKLSTNQEKVLRFVQDKTEGVTVDEVRHLFDGDPAPARGTLHQLVTKKAIWRRIVKKPCKAFGAGVVKIKTAIFYPKDADG